jgi:hypothetical protein
VFTFLSPKSNPAWLDTDILNAMANPPSNEVRLVLTAILYRRIRALDSAIAPQTMIDEGMLVDHTQFLNRVRKHDSSVGWTDFLHQPSYVDLVH